jgi:RNA polymerase sigma factor (sigma-70 family)
MKGEHGIASPTMKKNGNLGQSEWISLVFERYEGPLMRYATWLSGDAERARDVVQDTFLRLCAEEPGDVEGHLAEWLFTVCRNRALDVHRKESRLKPLTDFEIESQASPDPSPAVQVERQEATDQVVQLLKTLPSNQQEVVRLKFQFGLSYKEISRITNLTVTNVGFLLHTALKSLRHQLRTEFGLNENRLSAYEN